MSNGKWVHFTAIGGTGMGSLAVLMQELGWKVTGSDGPLYPPMSTLLESREIPLKTTYAPENLDGATWGLSKKHPDLIIVGNAISRGNPEAQRAEELLSKFDSMRMSFAQALAEFAIEHKKSLVIAGTHGKSTTTTLTAWALEHLGREPGFFIGGVPANFTFGCRGGRGNVFVSEGDEYDTAYWDKESKFLHYRAHWVLCTGIEFDHADIYDSVEAIEKSFLKLCDRTKHGWVLIDRMAAPRPASTEKIADRLNELGKKCVRYGTDPSSPYYLKGVESVALPWDKDQRGTRLTVKMSDWGDQEFFSPMTGRHNALNLLGCLALLKEAGEMDSPAKIPSFLQSFLGLKRRQEEVSRHPRLVVIDDFAHHPTAIRETINGVKGRYPGKSLAAFFEPRSATSARNVFAHEFAACFDEADAVFLTPPTKTNIPDGQKLVIESVLEEMTARPAQKGKFLCSRPGVQELVKSFDEWRKTQSKPVVALVMSNGAFGGIHKKLSELVSE